MLESLLPETGEILDQTQEETGVWVRLEPSERQYLSRTGVSSYVANPHGNEITISYKEDAKSLDYAIAHETPDSSAFTGRLQRSGMY